MMEVIRFNTEEVSLSHLLHRAAQYQECVEAGDYSLYGGKEEAPASVQECVDRESQRQKEFNKSKRDAQRNRKKKRGKKK